MTEADTAVAFGSGEVPVLATPRVLALAEQATVAAVAGALEASATTVGTRVELDHLAPSPVGADEVHAVLERVAGRWLVFAVRLRDGDRPVARGLIIGSAGRSPEVAATRRGRRPVGTFDILAAIIDVDQRGDWAWVQVHASPISVAEAHQFGDSDESTGGHWRNVPLTADAARALEVAARIADAYRLLPMPPGILALGLVWQGNFGAARALMQGANLTHAQLLELVQDAVVGTRLMALDEAVSDVVTVIPEASTGQQHAAMLNRQIEELLHAAAGAVPGRGDRAYQLLTTAAVMLILVSRDRPLWERATAHTGISLEAYEANLRWACAHPTEKVGPRETQFDAALAGIRLTDELSGAVEAAAGIASRVAGSEVPEVTGILAAVLLTVEGADARSGLAEPARLSLRQGVLQAVYGALVPDLDALVTEGQAARAAPATSDTATQNPPGAETVGFNIGTVVGAFVLAALGGVRPNVALVLAWLVRTVAAWQRKKARSQRLLPAVASAALVAAVALAVTQAPTSRTTVEPWRRWMRPARLSIAPI